MTTQRFADLYQHVLGSRLGLATAVRDNGDVTYRANGLTFIVNNTAPRDPEFLRVELRFTRPDQESTQVLRNAALDMTARLKGVKVLVDEHAYVLCHEGFISAPDTLPSVEQLCAVFPRVHHCLLHAASAFPEAHLLAAIELSEWGDDEDTGRAA